MTKDFDLGYIMALKRVKSEIQVYSSLIIDIEDMSDEEMDLATKICYDIVEMLTGEIESIEEF